MKDVYKILLYFVGIIVLGALLAPPLFWAGQAIAARGILPFLGETAFQKYFNRAMLVAAVALLWPLIRWLQVKSLADFGFDSDRFAIRHLFVGFLYAGLLVAAMAGVYVLLGFYHWKETLPWSRLPMIFLSAWVVATLEEFLFRGAFLGLLTRNLSPFMALVWTTTIFASVHFLKPDSAVVVTQVDWLAGFRLVPHVFHQFAEPGKLIAGFGTIFILGWSLGIFALRTRALWLPIGFHAGVVFVKMGFAKLTKRDAEYLPWVGPELQIGLVPLFVLMFGAIAFWIWLCYEAVTPPRR